MRNIVVLNQATESRCQHQACSRRVDPVAANVPAARDAEQHALTIGKVAAESIRPNLDAGRAGSRQPHVGIPRPHQVVLDNRVLRAASQRNAAAAGRHDVVNDLRTRSAC